MHDPLRQLHVLLFWRACSSCHDAQTWGSSHQFLHKNDHHVLLERLLAMLRCAANLISLLFSPRQRPWCTARDLARLAMMCNIQGLLTVSSIATAFMYFSSAVWRSLIKAGLRLPNIFLDGNSGNCSRNTVRAPSQQDKYACTHNNSVGASYSTKLI